MFGLSRASDQTIAEWRELGDKVCAALQLAGIPVHWMGEGLDLIGAEVEVDGADDEMGGVFITWRPAPELSKAVVECTSEGRNDAPIVQLSLSIAMSMRDAIVGILRSSDFDVVPFDDYDMRPPAVHVLHLNVFSLD